MPLSADTYSCWEGTLGITDSVQTSEPWAKDMHEISVRRTRYFTFVHLRSIIETQRIRSPYACRFASVLRPSAAATHCGRHIGQRAIGRGVQRGTYSLVQPNRSSVSFETLGSGLTRSRPATGLLRSCRGIVFDSRRFE